MQYGVWKIPAVSEDPFTLEINFEVLFRIKNLEIFLSTGNFHIGNKLSKANIDEAVDASFDVCKHWLTDQSERSVSEISSAKFHKIEDVLNCEIKFNLKFQKLTVHTSNLLAKGTNQHKFQN